MELVRAWVNCNVFFNFEELSLLWRTITADNIIYQPILKVIMIRFLSQPRLFSQTVIKLAGRVIYV